MPRPPRHDPTRNWLTTPEAAEMFEVSTDTIRNWIAKGKLKAHMVNGYNRIPRPEAVALAQELYGSIELPDTPG